MPLFVGLRKAVPKVISIGWASLKRAQQPPVATVAVCGSVLQRPQEGDLRGHGILLCQRLSPVAVWPILAQVLDSLWHAPEEDSTFTDIFTTMRMRTPMRCGLLLDFRLPPWQCW